MDSEEDKNISPPVDNSDAQQTQTETPATEAPDTDAQDVKVYAKSVDNRRLRRQAWRLTLVLFGLISATVLILTIVGSGSQDYSNVQHLSSLANLFILPSAAISGAYFAYKVSHPVKIKNPSSPRLSVNWFLVGLGFLFGVLPGLIWALIISYPLSKHACELSSAKYC